MYYTRNQKDLEYIIGGIIKEAGVWTDAFKSFGKKVFQTGAGKKLTSLTDDLSNSIFKEMDIRAKSNPLYKQEYDKLMQEETRINRVIKTEKARARQLAKARNTFNQNVAPLFANRDAVQASLQSAKDNLSKGNFKDTLTNLQQIWTNLGQTGSEKGDLLATAFTNTPGGQKAIEGMTDWVTSTLSRGVKGAINAGKEAIENAGTTVKKFDKSTLNIAQNNPWKRFIMGERLKEMNRVTAGKTVIGDAAKQKDSEFMKVLGSRIAAGGGALWGANALLNNNNNNNNKKKNPYNI